MILKCVTVGCYVFHVNVSVAVVVKLCQYALPLWCSEFLAECHWSWHSLSVNIIVVCLGDLMLLTWCGKQIAIPFRDEVMKGQYDSLTSSYVSFSYI